MLPMNCSHTHESRFVAKRTRKRYAMTSSCLSSRASQQVVCNTALSAAVNVIPVSWLTMRHCSELCLMLRPTQAFQKASIKKEGCSCFFHFYFPVQLNNTNKLTSIGSLLLPMSGHISIHTKPYHKQDDTINNNFNNIVLPTKMSV